MKLDLKNVTLYGVDTVDLERQLKAFAICESYADFGAKKIITNQGKAGYTDTGVEIIHTDKVNSLYDYNHFNLKHMNDYFDTDFVMVAEHDGFILNPGAWMDEFLHYDYIGAPWLKDGELIVGNGGFSIRSKKFMELTQSDPKIKLGTKLEDRYGENEDWVICMILRNYIASKGIKFAPVDIAKRFSLEENELLGGVWTDQFGFHGLRWTNISNWLKANPEYNIENPLDKV